MDRKDRPVEYISTRNQAGETASFEEVLLSGLARDGGLYVPLAWPSLDLEALKPLSYPERAIRIMLPFIGDTLTETEFSTMVTEACGAFDAPEVTPIRELGDQLYLLELFHGPTLAFKDIALQLLGRLFDAVLKKNGQHITIVGATSGDTGSAAIEACRDREGIEIFMLHPKGRVSDVQRRQMTTITSANVHNIAVEGSFDDCQTLVKAMFNDHAFRDDLSLSAINSINWARVMAQIVYYVHASLELRSLGKPLTFSVPTGNFGDIYAGYAASQMGLPVAELLIATNRNDILVRALSKGDYSMGEVMPTTSPSMDIQIASNFERLLFDLEDRESHKIQALMSELQDQKGFHLSPESLGKAQEIFGAKRVEEEECQSLMGEIYSSTGLLLDPHTAIGVAAAKQLRAERRGENADDQPIVCLATAHPAKFPAAVEKATGIHPDLPEKLGDLMVREEHYDILPDDLSALQSYIRSATGKNSGNNAGKIR